MSTRTNLVSGGVIQTEGFTRIPFRVEAVKVTDENMSAAAVWCGGEIHYSTKNVRNDANEIVERVKVPYIKVPVHNPLNERQTKAYAGDRILESDSGFKVYTERAFEKSFEPAVKAELVEAKIVEGEV